MPRMRFVLLLWLLSGCSPPFSGIGGLGGSAATLSIPDLYTVRIDSILTQQGVTGRSVLMLPAGECVVHRHPLGQKAIGPETERVLKLEGVERIQEPAGSYWGERPSTLSTYNCGTYALGDVIGLGPLDWLEPASNGATLFRSPIQLVLDSYFELKATHTLPVDWSALERDAAIHDDDVVCFVTHDGDATQSTILHVGRIDFHDKKNLVRSKLGEGPIVRASLKITSTEYFALSPPGQVNQIRVYRKQGGPSD